MAVFKKLKKNKDKAAPLPEPEPVKQLDCRIGMENYRDFFTLKNYWKTIDRKKPEAGGYLMSKFLNQFPNHRSLYPKLKNLPPNVDPTCSDTAFEAVAANYLKVFDEVISFVEEKPNDVQQAIDRLKAVGKMHRTKVPNMSSGDFQNMEEPFIYMVEQILQDRFNDKAHTLFKKFFQFCLQYLQEGFNG